MGFPLTLRELQIAIARETAKMSYPGGMSRGANGICVAGTKACIEAFFVDRFVATLWDGAPKMTAKCYDSWHKGKTAALGEHLQRQRCLRNPRNCPEGVAQKLINTFMHQLTKHERFRPLWPHLHLPLDGGVFDAFTCIRNRTESPVMTEICELIDGQSAYEISYDVYQSIQKKLWGLIDELNDEEGREFRLISRIELNLLWACSTDCC
jgi:hypothetical protein